MHAGAQRVRVRIRVRVRVRIKVRVRVRVRVKKLLYRIINLIFYWARARPGPARRATKGWPGPPGTRPGGRGPSGSGSRL